MLETSLFVASIATLSMLFPGPDFFLVIKNAARYQRLAVMMTVLGVTCGVATHMSYCIAGLAVVITTTPWLFNMLKYAGAVCLIWIGGFVVARWRQDERQQSAPTTDQPEKCFPERLSV